MMENQANKEHGATKHIMLLFLSLVRVSQDHKSIATTNYEGIGDVYTTNESAVRYLYNAEGRIDKFFMIKSTKVGQDISYDIPDEKGKKTWYTYKFEDGSTCSHIDYFKRRIKDITDACHSQYEEEVFNEKGKEIETMECVLNMADKIKSYVNSLPPGTQVVLHADSTGGMRNANMVIMAVLRILQYSGVQIGKILYSNYDQHQVEESAYIYDLFDLISGAEEFVNFGSVNTINRYFDHKEKSDVLKRLLGAMNRFSEEMRLCHRQQLEEAAKSLHICLKDFQEKKENDMSSRLMHQLEERLMKDYEPILIADKGNLNILTLINWCLEHDYLQQALTLYVEGIPDLLYENKVFALPDDKDKAKEIEAGKSEELSLPFYFLTVYDGKKVEEDKTITQYEPVCKAEKAVSEFSNRLKEIYMENMKAILAGRMTAKEAGENVTQEAEKIVVQKVKELRVISFNSPENISSFFCNLEQWHKNPKLLLGDVDDGVLNRLYINKMPEWQKLKYGRQRLDFLSNYLDNHVKDKDLKKAISDCRLEYAFRFLSFAEQGWAKLGIDREAMRRILNDYGYFKNERNSSNHARLDSDVIMADDLKHRMQEGIIFIESVLENLMENNGTARV